MNASQTNLDGALAFLQQMPRESGMCLQHTRQALLSVGLKLPAPMASPRNTALENFNVLAADPSTFGWRPVGLDDSYPIKLVYFDQVAWLTDPPRWAGHVGLLSGNVIYSDSNYPLSSWWRSKFAGAFVPINNGPRLIVAKPAGQNGEMDGNTYQEIASQWDAANNVLDVDTAALQAFLGTSVAGLASMTPIRDALQAIGVNATFNLTHMNDDSDPRIYVFT